MENRVYKVWARDSERAPGWFDFRVELPWPSAQSDSLEDFSDLEKALRVSLEALVAQRLIMQYEVVSWALFRCEVQQAPRHPRFVSVAVENNLFALDLPIPKSKRS